jgi:uncharacterized membrane protein YeaQ/YmgE (transglycosylase-associated protein family)
MDIVVLLVVALVIGFLVDLFVPGKRPWAWLLTMLAAALGGAAAGYTISSVNPFINNLSLWPMLLAALLAAILVRLTLRLTKRPSPRLYD